MTASRHGPECGCARCRGFASGNDVALRHGAYVALDSSPRVAEIEAWVEETQPVSHPADRGAIHRLAPVYARLERSTAALDRVDDAFERNPLGAFADDAEWLGRLRDDHARWLREAGRVEAELARTPASRAKLGLHLALGRRALTVVELHEAAALEGPPRRAPAPRRR